MAIGVVSDNDFTEELKKLKGEATPTSDVIIVEKPIKGRNEGDNNVPESLRKIIGEEAVLNGRSAALGLAGMFGISPSSVSAYTNGSTSTKSYNSPSASITDHLSKVRTKAIRRASKTLNGALGAITQEKLDYTDADKLAGIAKDMSVIIKNLEPEKVMESNQPTSQFVIYAPQFRDERSFDTIQVVEE
jgi:transcriptional regulator with XRE-family HTH domain